MALALLVLAALLALWWGAHVWYRNTLLTELRGDVRAELDPYGNALTIDLRRRFDIIYGFARLDRCHFFANRTNWESSSPSPASLAKTLLACVIYRSRRMAWPGSSIHGPATRRLVGVNILNGSPFRGARRCRPGNSIAQDRHQRPLRNARRADSARWLGWRCFTKSSFGDWSHVALELPPILAEVGLLSQQSMQLALRDGLGRVFFGNPAVFDSNPMVLSGRFTGRSLGSGGDSD